MIQTIFVLLLLLATTAGAQTEDWMARLGAQQMRAVMARQQTQRDSFIINPDQYWLMSRLRTEKIDNFRVVYVGNHTDKLIADLSARLDSLEARLQVQDYRIAGSWVENKRFQGRVDGLEAKLGRAHIVVTKDSIPDSTAFVWLPDTLPESLLNKIYPRPDKHVLSLKKVIYTWKRKPCYIISFGPEGK